MKERNEVNLSVQRCFSRYHRIIQVEFQDKSDLQLLRGYGGTKRVACVVFCRGSHSEELAQYLREENIECQVFGISNLQITRYIKLGHPSKTSHLLFQLEISMLCRLLSFLRSEPQSQLPQLREDIDDNTCTYVAPPSKLRRCISQSEDKCKLLIYFSMNQNQIFIYRGDTAAKELFQIENFANCPIDVLFGPATCHITVQRLHASLSTGTPCTMYINLYKSDGFPVSMFGTVKVLHQSSDAFDANDVKNMAILQLERTSVRGNILLNGEIM